MFSRMKDTEDVLMIFLLSAVMSEHHCHVSVSPQPPPLSLGHLSRPSAYHPRHHFIISLRPFSIPIYHFYYFSFTVLYIDGDLYRLGIKYTKTVFYQMTWS